MPKMKTNKSAKKRFKVTASGKVIHRSANRGHLKTQRKTKKQIRQARAHTLASASDAVLVLRLLGQLGRRRKPRKLVTATVEE